MSTVPGEAPESDDEEVQPPQTAATAAVIVSGEEEESGDETLPSDTQLKVEPAPTLPPPKLADEEKQLLKQFNSVLHAKLFADVRSFRASLAATKAQAYDRSSKEISSVGQQLLKTHSYIQDVSHNMRLLTNDLFHLEDRIDIVTSCNLLPEIRLPLSASSSASAEA